MPSTPPRRYEIYLKEGDQFLLAARKRKKNKSSNYLISLDKDDLARQSGNFFGKLRSNFVGTEFQLYDKGINPEKADEGQKAGASSMVQVRQKLGTVSSRDPVSHAPLAPLQVRQELGTVLYKQNVLGSRGPRKMQVCVPRVDHESNQRHTWQPSRKDEEMLTKMKSRDYTNLTYLINKPPRWNDQVGAYVLNFNGRVTMASVKNFQLVEPDEQDAVLLQFGRVGNCVEINQ